MTEPPGHPGPEVLDTPQAGPAALRGSALRTGGYVLGILLSLIAVPLLIDHLGTAGYGRYVAVIALIAIVGGVTEGGLNAIALREYTIVRGEERTRLMRDALGVRIVLTGVGAGGAVLFAVLAGYGSRLVLGTALAGVALMAQLIQSLLGVALQGELRFGWVTAADLLRQIVSVALLVVLVLAGAGVVAFLGAAIPASVASLGLTVVLVRGRMPLRPTFAPGRWWELLRDAVPWAAIAAVNVVYFRLTLVLMSVVATTLETGYFAVSFRIVEILVAVPLMAVGAAYPILTRSVTDDRDRFAFAATRIFELALVAGGWLVVCVEVGAAFAIHALAQHKADPSIAVLRIQGLAVLASFVSVACGYPLLTMRRYRAVVSANIAALLASALLTLILVGPLGARGAAIAAVAAESLLAVASAVLLARAARDVHIGVPTVGAVALAGAAACAAGLGPPLHPILGALVASLVYFGVLRLLGRFPPEARQLLRSLRR